MLNCGMDIFSHITKYYWSQGFGDAELDDGTHLHLWLPEWSPSSHPMVHSHSYLFNSKILIGSMIAGEFRKESNPDGEWSFVSENPEPESVDMIFVEMILVKRGDTYDFGGPERFHYIPYNTAPVLAHFIVIPHSSGQEGAGFAIKKEDIPKKFPLADPPTEQEIEKGYRHILRKLGA